jgi:uncharacterized membrane protein YfcA
MNSFWNGAFGQFRNCGHNAHLVFLVGVAGLCGILTASLLVVEFRDYIGPALGICFIVATVWMLIVRRLRRPSRLRQHLPLSPHLSADELRAAREKLRAGR